MSDSTLRSNTFDVHVTYKGGRKKTHGASVGNAMVTADQLKKFYDDRNHFGDGVESIEVEAKPPNKSASLERLVAAAKSRGHEPGIPLPPALAKTPAIPVR